MSERRESGDENTAPERPAMGPVTISDVQELMRRKDEIEAQIKAYYDVLEDQKGVGMNEPLVDIEGYPRADVDVYQVRTARHNIICLQNDHKALMKQVEEALHQLHARGKEKQARDAAEAQNEALNQGQGPSRSQSQSQSPPRPFAKVNSISPGSPASNSGLQVDDEIVELGSVNAHNFQNLQNIGTVVQHSEGHPLNVTVVRGGERLQLRLVPMRWAGKGLLGAEPPSHSGAPLQYYSPAKMIALWDLDKDNLPLPIPWTWRWL